MINIKVFEDISFVAIATKIELYRVEFEIYRMGGPTRTEKFCI